MVNSFTYAIFKPFLHKEKIIDRYIDRFSCKGKNGKIYAFALLVKHSTATGYVNGLLTRGEFLCMSIQYYKTPHRYARDNVLFAFFFREDSTKDWQLNDEFDIKMEERNFRYLNPTAGLFLKNNGLGSQVYKKFEKEAKKFGIKELRMNLSTVDAQPENLELRNYFWKKMGFNVYSFPDGHGYIYKKLKQS